MNDIGNLGFESAFAELEQVVQQLEAGDLPLEQAMALFERGMALAAHCNARLDAAELRVSQLVSRSGGEYELRPFEEYPSGEELEQK
jgi:exodeoxyribonuclease VII small subunit